MPLGLNLKLRPALSRGAPSKPVPASLPAILPLAYGFAEGLGVGATGGGGGGVGMFLVFAYILGVNQSRMSKRFKSTLIEANLGCIGLYLSFLD